MGLNYAFELIVSAKQVDALLLALTQRLCHIDAERLFAVLPWSPNLDADLVWGSGRPSRERSGIRGLQEAYGIQVSMLFAPDETIEMYDREHPFERERGMFRIEGLNLNLHVGDEFAVLRAECATSHISRTFRDSESIRRAFVELAQATSAKALFFDVEDRTWTCLHPLERAVHRPNILSYQSSDSRYLRTDHYAEDELDLIREA